MLPGWHMGAFELMNTGLVKVFIMSSCSEHMLDPEKHLSFNPCLSSSGYFKTKCCDSEFISSVSFSNSHLLMAAQLFLFSVMTPTVGGKKREWELCFVFPWGVTNRQCALWKENVFIFKRAPKQWDFIMAYLQIIIHRHFNITNFLPLEEMFHRLHFSFCGQLSNLSSYYPESFCGTVLMNAVTAPCAGLLKGLDGLGLARLFRWQLQQMRVRQEHGRGCVIT